MIHLLALLGVVSISFSAVFVRLAGVSPVTATFFRTGYAVPALLAIWLVVRRRDERTRRERLWALGAGLILSVDLSLWHYAIHLMGVGLSTVVANMQVVFVAIAAWLLHKERPGQDLTVRAVREDGSEQSFPVRVRINSEGELAYYRNGGILHYVLRNLASQGEQVTA